MDQFTKGQKVHVNGKEGKIYKVDYNYEIVTIVFMEGNLASYGHYSFDGKLLGNKMSVAITKQSSKFNVNWW